MFTKQQIRNTVTYEIIVNGKQDGRYSFIAKDEALTVAKRLSKEFNKVEVKRVELIYLHIVRKT